MKIKMVCTLALAACALAISTVSAQAQGPFAVRLGMYGSSDNQSRVIADNKGFIVGVQYTLSGVPAVLNGEAWSTVVSADYYFQFTDKSVRFKAIPVSISQIYTFEEQGGKTPYAGFCLTAITYTSTLVSPKQPWVTRYGAGLVLGLNMSDKWFIEGRYEKFRVHHAAGVPNGFRATLGYRF